MEILLSIMSKEELDKMKGQISDLHEALLGNQYNKSGLIDRLEKVEKYVNADKRLKWMGAGVVAAISWLLSNAKEIWHWMTAH